MPQSHRLSLFSKLSLLATLGLVLSSHGLLAQDLLIADFEQDSYGDWEVTGEAFGAGPARGTLEGQMNVEGFLGNRLVNSFFQGDRTTGTLTSPVFRIERKYITFLIGGGQDLERLAVQLIVDDQIVHRSTGSNDQPGGSESLAPDYWEVSGLIGQQARIRIVDQATGSWGHINVDQIQQSDTRPRGFVNNVERQIVASDRYLHFPIKNGAPRRVVTLLIGDQVIVRNDIELADSPAEVDWWAPMDVSSWQGEELTIRVDRLHEDSQALPSIDSSNEIKDSENLYAETMRGQFHFSPRRGWNNDPNGCVYFNGEYHLFFQHNPYGWSWGNMHWGHAVSKDLLHWEELGDVLLPDEMGPMFSGSAVVDWNNTSGFGTADQPALVLIYTAAGNPTVQGIAYSTDGRNFTKYSANPVLGQITPGNRDPKVIWHEPSQQWVMTLYVEWENRHTIHFFTSPNLKDWTLASMSRGDGHGGGYLFECPDFFELPIEGNPAGSKWVLLGANSEYGVGSFDGSRFIPDATRLRGHAGREFYAAQSFSDVPDGRRILIGWWRTETRGMPFNQSMSLPLELELRQTDDGPRMTFAPIRELETLRATSHTFESFELAPGAINPLDEIRAELVEVRIEFEPGDAEHVVMNIRDVMVEYDVAKQELSVAGHKAMAPLQDGKQRLIVYCDRIGVEVFASDGLCYVPMPYNTNPENRRLFLETRGGSASIMSLEVHELESVWKSSGEE